MQRQTHHLSYILEPQWALRSERYINAVFEFIVHQEQLRSSHLFPILVEAVATLLQQLETIATEHKARGLPLEVNPVHIRDVALSSFAGDYNSSCYDAFWRLRTAIQPTAQATSRGVELLGFLRHPPFHWQVTPFGQWFRSQLDRGVDFNNPAPGWLTTMPTHFRQFFDPDWDANPPRGLACTLPPIHQVHAPCVWVYREHFAAINPLGECLSACMPSEMTLDEWDLAHGLLDAVLELAAIYAPRELVRATQPVVRAV